jgi:small subunit ribosomal protein S1
MDSPRHKLAESLRRAFENSEGGIITLVETILEHATAKGIRLDWRDEACQIRASNGNGPIELSVPFRKAVFRAILARIFALCNERDPGKISPYGGEADLENGAHSRRFHAVFMNTPSEQYLEIRSLTSNQVSTNETNVTTENTTIIAEPAATAEPTAAPPAGAAPEAAPAAAPETPATPAAPAAAPAKPPAAKGKKPFRGDRPKQDRPKLDFTELTTNVRLNELDKDIEDELAQAMAGFEEEIKEDSEAAKKQAMEAPKAVGGRKKGRIISIHGQDVFIDVPGGRSQGFMPITQFDKPPSIGDEVEFAVEGYDAANGVLKLTREGSAQTVDWSSVQIGQTVEARVTGTNKGGLAVEVNGIRGFLPISQIDIYRVENAEQFVNQRLLCMVAEVNPSERNLVVSRKALLEREREKLREQFWAEVEEGQVLKGTVRSIQPFGAFVDLGGADGLLPVSELSWGRVGTPNEVVSLGQQVEVKVKRVDRNARKLSLSLKDLLQSPWDTLSQRFPVGSQLMAKVTKIMEFGAFAEVEPGVEGLIHISEMILGRGGRIRDRVQEGTPVEVQILNIDKDAQRMSLSMKAIELAKQKAETDAAKAEMAARQAGEEAVAEEDEPRPKKRFPFQLRGGK